MYAAVDDDAPTAAKPPPRSPRTLKWGTVGRETRRWRRRRVSTIFGGRILLRHGSLKIPSRAGHRLRAIMTAAYRLGSDYTADSEVTLAALGYRMPKSAAMRASPASGGRAQRLHDTVCSDVPP